MTRLLGCGTALVTPFTEQGQVDLPALRALVDWQIVEGIDFLVACGSTGEAQTLDEGERERVVAAVVEVAAGRVPVMAGATSNDTARAVDETGYQMAIFGRLGSRPFNRAEMERFFTDRWGRPYRVTDEPDMTAWLGVPVNTAQADGR